MKAYKKQINTAKEQQKQVQKDPEPKEFTDKQELRVKFMQGLVKNARVYQ